MTFLLLDWRILCTTNHDMGLIYQVFVCYGSHLSEAVGVPRADLANSEEIRPLSTCFMC